MGTVTLQQIFQDAFPAYEQAHLLPLHVRRAGPCHYAVPHAALGGHIQACPDGHVERICTTRAATAPVRNVRISRRALARRATRPTAGL